MSLSILLSSSSFFLSDYLIDKINTNSYTNAELEYALKLKIPEAYQVKISQQSYGSDSWLKYAKVLAKNDGHSSAILAEFYITEGQKNKSVFWYKQAITLNYLPAILPLAKIYFNNNQLELSRRILAQDSEGVLDNLLFTVKVAIAQGDTLFVNQHLAQLNNTMEGRSLLLKVKHYRIIDPLIFNAKVFPIPEKSRDNCQVKIQVFATSLADLERATELKKQFNYHPLSRFACLETPRYIAINKLTCGHTADRAIQCDEDIWQGLAGKVESRFLAVLYPYGGANVHLGIMYFDRQDTIEVFSHEVAHLFGFIDEYSLPKNHTKCREIQTEMFAHNIAVLAKKYYGLRAEVRQNILSQISWGNNIALTTPILTRADNLSLSSVKEEVIEQTWLLGTPVEYNNEIGIFIADTCQAEKLSAFKPLSQRTQLLYYELQFPHQFLQFLAEEPDKFLMPSFHYNVAMALLGHGNIKQGKEWLLKAATKESTKERKIKILQGKL